MREKDTDMDDRAFFKVSCIHIIQCDDVIQSDDVIKAQDADVSPESCILPLHFYKDMLLLY